MRLGGIGTERGRGKATSGARVTGGSDRSQRGRVRSPRRRRRRKRRRQRRQRRRRRQTRRIRQIRRRRRRVGAGTSRSRRSTATGERPHRARYRFGQGLQRERVEPGPVDGAEGRLRQLYCRRHQGLHRHQRAAATGSGHDSGKARINKARWITANIGNEGSGKGAGGYDRT